jgi:hypothetical protein
MVWVRNPQYPVWMEGEGIDAVAFGIPTEEGELYTYRLKNGRLKVAEAKRHRPLSENRRLLQKNLASGWWVLCPQLWMDFEEE